jgi:pimeloyl-ACP methyl ester carboxylesterase
VRVDNRGTGASDKPRDAFTLEDMAKDAIAVLDAVGADKVHVVGISMGGMIAQLLALDHAARVDHLVLMSTHYGGFELVMPAPEVAVIFMRPPAMSRDDIVRNAMRLITAPGYADKNPQAVEELVRLALAEPTPNAIFGSQMQAIIGSDRSARVSSIRAPTLILHGDADPLIPFENGRRLAQAMPQARFEVLKGCGHLPMWEACDEVIGLLNEFLPAG